MIVPLQARWVRVSSIESKLPTIVVSALAGAAIGFLGARYSGEPESAPSETRSQVSETGAPGNALTQRQAVRRTRGPGVLNTEPDRTDEARAVEDLDETELRTQLAEAREEIARLREEKHDVQGKAFPFPADLDSKFKKEALIDKLNEAFEKEGVDAEVDVADCEEYPCILCATLGRDEGAPDLDKHLSNMRKVAESEVLSPYEDAERHGSAFSKQSREDGKNTNATVVCQALYPKPEDPADAEAHQRRIKHRASQLEEGY